MELWEDGNKHSLKYLSYSHSVLDLGCGSLDVLKALPKNVQVIGVDSNLKDLKKSSYANLVLASAYHLPFRSLAFDALHCRAVIHHLDFKRLFRELENVCQPNCHVCIAEPLKGIFARLLRRIVTTDYHEPGEVPFGHIESHLLPRYIEVTDARFLFGELPYLVPFLIPILPRILRNLARNLSRNFIRFGKRLPYPPAYILVLGRIRPRPSNIDQIKLS